MDACPVSCIHWVTAPQLDLLEQSMAEMDRVAVWALMGGNVGNNLNVFYEAKLAWARRQSRIQEQIYSAKYGNARATAAREARSAQAAEQAAGAPKDGGFGASFWGMVNNMKNMTEPAGPVRATAGGGAANKSPNGSSSGGASASGAGGSEEQAWSGRGASSSSVSPKDIAVLAAKAARATRLYRTAQEGRRQFRSALRLPAGE